MNNSNYLMVLQGCCDRFSTSDRYSAQTCVLNKKKSVRNFVNTLSLGEAPHLPNSKSNIENVVKVQHLFLRFRRVSVVFVTSNLGKRVSRPPKNLYTKKNIEIRRI